MVSRGERLLRESRSQPMTVLNSGRFSTHWFILLSDVLVHVGYSGHATYPLATIWVDAVPDSSDTAAKVRPPRTCSAGRK